MKKITIAYSVYGLWNGLPLVIRALVSGMVVSSVGVFTWGALLSAFQAAWVVVPMAAILWVYWKYYSGNWGPKRTTENRRMRFRSTTLSGRNGKYGLAAAVLFVVAVQALFVITFRIIQFPATQFTADYKALDHFPLWVAFVILIMSSIVAGICEEAGFRGYMQAPLEKRYGPVIAITLTSFCFTLIHLGHTWALPILPHIFFASVLLGIIAWKSGSLIPGIIGHSILDIFDYSVWWTDLTGGFKHQPIFKTGLDIHFIVWVAIFSISIYLFFSVIRKLNKHQILQPIMQQNELQLINGR
jgi:membrane protease YdiL (CAAX protease family)